MTILPLMKLKTLKSMTLSPSNTWDITNSLSSSIFGSTTFHLTKNPSKINHNNRSSLNISMSHLPKRRCDFYDLHKEIVPYTEAWSWQKQIVEQRKKCLDDDFADTLIILQHQPVYTLGTGSSEGFLNFDVNNPPIDLYRTERGGQVTYHGPGQLVMYPILNLRYYELDLHWYLRALEEVGIRALSSAFDIKASRVEGLTGVWVGDQKLAAIGIKGSGWITYHGLALNVTTDMTPFKRIVPCGIHDRQVGSIKGLLTESFSNKECGEEVCYRFEDTKLIDITHKAMVREFCEVFQVDLHYRSMKSSCRIDDLLLHPH